MCSSILEGMSSDCVMDVICDFVHGKRCTLSDSKEACPLRGEEACPSFELVTVRYGSE